MQQYHRKNVLLKKGILMHSFKILIMHLIFIFSILFEAIFAQINLYVYSPKNILPDEKLSVQVNVSNALSQKVYFEVYRIISPQKFIEKEIDFLNFTQKHFEQVSDEIELILKTEKFAQLHRYWFSDSFDLEKVTTQGTYLIKVQVDTVVAFTFTTCSNLGLITKRTTENVLIFVSDRLTSKPISDLSLTLVAIDKKLYKARTNLDGIALVQVKDRVEDGRLYIIIESKEFSLLMQDVIFSPSYDYQKFIVYTYTNQPVYRPNQKVFFKTIIRQRDNEEIISYAFKSVKIKIVNPLNETCFYSELQTNKNGAINGEYEIPQETSLGEYTIYVEVENENHPHSFFVEEYKKPEYKVAVTTDKDNYAYNDTIQMNIKAEYYFGQPLSQGKVRIEIFKKPLIRHWWEFEPFSTLYRSCFIDIIPYYQPELIHIDEKELHKGELKYFYKLDSKDEKNYEYIINVICSDESNRQVANSKKVYVTYSDLFLTTTPSKYFYLPDQTITIKVLTTDFAHKPVTKEFQVIVQKMHFINFEEYYEDIDTLEGKTLSDGAGFIHFQIKEEGKYSYYVKVKHRDKTIIQRNNFIVGKIGSSSINIGEGLQLIPSKDVYNENDDIELLIISPVNDVQVFLSLEQSQIYYHKLIEIKGNTQFIKIPRYKTLLSITHIFAGFYFDNSFYTSLKRIAFYSNKNKLQVQIIPNKEKFKPKEKGEFKIKVTNFENKPVEGVELLSSIIDESILAIKQEKSQNIFDYFNSSSLYKIYTASTEIIKIPNFHPFNFELSSYEQKEKKLKLTGNSKLSGIIIEEISNNPVSNVEVKLVSKRGITFTKTDENGFFNFTKIPAGNYDLFITGKNHLRKVIKNILVRSNITYDIGKIVIQRLVYNEYFINRQPSSPFINLEFQRSEERIAQHSIQKDAIKTSSEILIRKDFKDAIFWNPLFVTDENGEAKIELTYPDNLTTWRNTIKAIFTHNQFGESITNVITTKNLIVRIEHPRYLHEKDESTIIINVHNYFNQDKLIRLTILVKDADILEITSKNNFIKSHVMKSIDVNVNSLTSEKIMLRIKVKEKAEIVKILVTSFIVDEPKESDAIEVSFPIEPLGIPNVEVYNVNLFSSRASYVQKINLDKNLDNTQLSISFSSSLLNPILSSIDELVGYPYGCVEQTMSRFLPTIIVANLLNELNLKINSKTLEELPKMVSAGVNRLKEFQHVDGGWGWWTNDQTNPYMTAYVIYGLSLTKKAGFSVPASALSLGIRNLKTQIQNNVFIDERTLSYMIYALSESIDFSEQSQEDLELIKKYFAKLIVHDKDPYISALLLQFANKFSLNDYIPLLTKRLIQLATKEGSIVYWGDGQNYGRLISDRTEITSQAIKALVQSNVDDIIIENGIRWLMNSRKGNYWISTKQTATVIFALVDYLKKKVELQPEYIVRILVNGREFKSINVDKTYIQVNELKLKIPESFLKYGVNEIKFEKQGKGSFYSTILVKSYIDRDLTEHRNILVDRKYFKIIQIKEGDKYIKKLEEIKDSVKVGDKILVQIRVKNNFELEYFMLEDWKVPGLEVINEISEHGNNLFNYTHKENRDSKYSFFTTTFNTGEKIFSYIAYAQIPGNYNIKPAIASLMYYPDINGVSKFEKIKILE